MKELWLAVGRRGGKDSIASAIAVYCAALGDYKPYLRPGERAVVLCLACDRQQSLLVFRMIKACFEECPLLRPLVKYVSDSDGYLELKNHVDIVVATNSYRAVRGRTIAVAILDEVAYFRDESSASPDVELYNAIRPGTVTLRPAGSMIIGISSVYKRSGSLFDKWRQYHGVDSDDVLCILAPSKTFNPTLSQSEIDRDLEEDPAKASAEWLSHWREDVSSYLSAEVVEAAVNPGVFEIGYTARYNYTAFADVAGGSGRDSFTIAIAHPEGDRAVVDLIREQRPPFSPELATEQMCQVLRSYRVHKVVGDKYGGDWPSEQFAKNGVIYEASERTKTQIYHEAVSLWNSRRIDIPDNRRLVSQLINLEARSIRGGRVTVDHPQNGMDDLANCVCGAATLLISDSREAIVRRYLLRGAGLI